jgi:hypothetical protein
MAGQSIAQSLCKCQPRCPNEFKTSYWREDINKRMGLYLPGKAAYVQALLHNSGPVSSVTRKFGCGYCNFHVISGRQPVRTRARHHFQHNNDNNNNNVYFCVVFYLEALPPGKKTYFQFNWIIIIIIIIIIIVNSWPPLRPSGQRSWPQIRRPGFDSRQHQKKVVGLERGPLSLVSTTVELLDRKVAAPVYREYGRRDPSRWPCGTFYPQKLAITSPTSGSHSVGIVRSRTQTMEFRFF